MSNNFCDKHKVKKRILFGNLTYCQKCDDDVDKETTKKVNKDGFVVPDAPTFVEEHYYYAVLEDKKNWSKKPQFVRVANSLAPAMVELKLKTDSKLGVKFRVAKVLTSTHCVDWLPSGISSPTYAVWNGIKNTPVKVNGRHSTLIEWVKPQLNYPTTQTGRFSTKSTKKIP